MFKFLIYFLILSFPTLNVFSQENTNSNEKKKIISEYTKVGVVDMRKILNESTAYQGVVEQFEDIRRKQRNRMTKKEDELRDEENNLFKQKNIISKEAYSKKLKDLTNKVNLLKKETNEEIKKYEITFEKATMKIQSSLVDVLAKIANDKQLDLVLAKDQVLLVGKDIDLTEESIGKLNEILPKLKFDAPTQ
tara:strand:- start:82 stop:657 length:576 start_codon:yes stop_codon:yes gene_type:complete